MKAQAGPAPKSGATLGARAVAGEVLIVVPCLNEAAHLPGLLRLLLGGPATWRIAVADGGSTDGSVDIVSRLALDHPNLTLLPNPRRIQSAGVNLAVRRFGEGVTWLVRIDAHCRYPANYVAGLIAAAQRAGADSVVVPMVTLGETCFQKACAAAQNSALGAGGSAHRRVGASGFVDHGHHALFRLEDYAAAGGYDETFSHNEDAELDTRLLAAGARIWLESSLAIGYFPRSRPAALFRQYAGYGKGRAKTLQRHRSRMKLRQLLPLGVAPAIGLLIPALWWWPLAMPALAWAAICLAAGTGLAIKNRSACVLLSGPAAMIMHAAWSLGFWNQMIAGKRPGSGPEAITC